MQTQMDQRKAEPNSGLGGAIHYMLKRWDRLTRFLSVPGAPLDNNVTERGLKTAILHRKNSLSYKTLAGARVRHPHEPDPHLRTQRSQPLRLPHP